MKITYIWPLLFAKLLVQAIFFDQLSIQIITEILEKALDPQIICDQFIRKVGHRTLEISSQFISMDTVKFPPVFNEDISAAIYSVLKKKVQSYREVSPLFDSAISRMNMRELVKSTEICVRKAIADEEKIISDFLSYKSIEIGHSRIFFNMMSSSKFIHLFVALWSCFKVDRSVYSYKM